MESDFEKRGLGEIVDEIITLSFKMITKTNPSQTVNRLAQLNKYMEDENCPIKSNLELYHALGLMMANASCWLSQDCIMDKNIPESSIVLFAKEAQRMNSERNKLIGLINKGSGVVTSKSYMKEQQ